MKKLTILLVSALVCLQALAIPAHKGLVQMPQPDGTMVTIGLEGDEFYHFNVTADGYTVIQTDEGAFVYAQREGNNLVATNVLAHDEGQRNADELALLSNTPKRLIDAQEVEVANVRRIKRNVDLSNFDFDKFHGLVILVDFPDVSFNSEDPKAFYTELFSTENLTSFVDPKNGRTVNCQGSVRDYFSDQSNGVFKPPFDVYGPYTSTKTSTQANRYSQTIFEAALKTANAEVDFSQYDNNHDGRVDMIYFLVAGYSSSYGGNNSGYLWPHASNLMYRYISYDGKWMDRYACSTELYGWENTPSTVVTEGIGTVAHEFSHVLGLPDFYDTDYEEGGGQSHDPGGWDVMAGGADYNYGRSPVGYSLYERYALGWATPTEITKAGSYELEPVNTSRTGYILRTPVNNEYFTLENRQRSGWDSYLPGHGLLVCRVDSTNASIWSSNKVNCNPAHNYFEILRAGNSTSGDSSSDPFPGTLGNPMITNDTYPNLLTWAGVGNDFNIVGIKEQNNIISFNVVNEGNLQMLIEDFEDMPVSTGTADQNVEGCFANWTFNKAGVRAPGEGKADGENSVMMKLPSQFYSVTPIYYNCYMATLTVFNQSSTTAKYSLETSIDDGQTWTKAFTPNNSVSAEIPAKSTALCYWNLDVNNHQPVLFRIAQVGGNKNTATYVDNFTIYYTGDEGGPIDNLRGDVNCDNEVNLADVNAVVDIVLGGQAEAETLKRADVNGDEEINIADINTLIDIILK
jgi:M6 family metalloprotease-like protein